MCTPGAQPPHGITESPHDTAFGNATMLQTCIAAHTCSVNLSFERHYLALLAKGRCRGLARYYLASPAAVRWLHSSLVSDEGPS